jgi:2-haloacid dehalogenase
MFDPRSKQVLTFHCYGTLIDWETGITSALQPFLRSHGVKLDDEHVLESFAEFESAAERGPYMIYRDVLATCLHGFGTLYGFTPSGDELTSFSGSVGVWPAFPDSAEALSALKHCFKLAVLTNMDDDLFELSNKRLGVTFDYIITAQQVRSYKPSVNHFRVALERIGLPKERILHVAQSLFHDHVPAKQLGGDTVWVNRRHDKAGFGATPPAEAQPDIEMPDMRSVAEALCLFPDQRVRLKD